MLRSKKKSYKVVAVIVTYGNRAHLATATISAALRSGVSKIILVANGNQKPINEDRLNEGERQNIHIIESIENLGSAGGFNLGIKSALEENIYDYVWLLDDDNMPETEALSKLIEWNEILIDNASVENSRIALFSFRKKRKWQHDILSGLPLKTCLPPDNSCYGFHINETNKIFRKKNLKFNCNLSSHAFIPYGPYGGLFAPIEVLQNSPLPNEEFFLYFDDVEYSMRMAAGGVRLYLIRDSVIDDLEPSWANKLPRSTVFKKLLTEEALFRVFYGVRNRLYVESRRRSPNKTLFYFNVAIFSSILIFLSLLYGRPKRAIFILGAMKEGLLGKLVRRKLDSENSR